MTGPDVDLEVVGLADLEHLDRARQALDQRVVDRLVAEHAGGGRALLAGVQERRLHERGDDLVEVGVGVDDHAVLAAHLGDHALEVLLAGRRLGRGPDDVEPDLVGAREGDRVHARVAHERGADVALAGQQRERRRRHARLAQRARDHQGTARRLLGGLEDHGVAGRQAGGGHPERDREREVPRRDDGHDPAGVPAQLVALAGRLEQGSALREVDRPARVVLEEVDRLADVAVGLRPRLGALAHGERRGLEPPLAQPLRRADQRGRALLGGRVPAARDPERLVDLAGPRRGRLGDHTVGLAGIGRGDVRALALVIPDPHRDLQRTARVVLLQRVGEAGAHRRAPELEDRLVGERLHAAADARGLASSSSSAVPFACSARKLSFEVFSSRRRTR